MKKEVWFSKRRWLFSWLSLRLLASLLSACAADSAQPPLAPALRWEDVCIDLDQDGYGFQCAPGADCDDADPAVQEGCSRSCNGPSEGCACEPNTEPSSCSLPYSVSASGSLLCKTGTRYCRDGSWSACEGVKTFELPASGTLLSRALLGDDAGVLTCSPCQPDCYRVDDTPNSGAGGGDAGIVSAPNGGITLGYAAGQPIEVDAGLLDDVTCTPGVAPDHDCDGIPTRFDPYPDAPPFASDHKTLFMDLGPGESAQQAFDIQFFVNTADIYFYLDMTASMEGERDNLIASLTSGNYLPNRGNGISCADRNFDGRPDDELKSAGIAGNIACLIRDARLGAGFFRDIPFEGPYANGIRVAPSDFEMFEHRQDITGDVAKVRNALSAFTTQGNYNTPEGSMQGLWSLVTGAQLYAGWDRPGVPARKGCPAGTWGYGCFRDEAVPIVIHITDAPLQNGPSPTSASRAGYLTDCQQECTCKRETCSWGFCWCAEQTCSCGNTNRHPLDYDASVLAGMKSGSEGAFRSLTQSAETLANAEPVGSVQNVLVSYAGDTKSMSSDLDFSATGNCPSGSSAWSSSSQRAPEAVFRFRVDAEKSLTVSTRGSRFDTALLIKKVGSSSVLACNNDRSSSDVRAEITRSFAAGEYYAVLKGRTNDQSGWFQLTIGDTSKQTTKAFAAKKWLGDGAGGTGSIRQALRDRRVRVITVNSSDDPYLIEQSKVLSTATEALDIEGNPLTFSINTNGTGMGTAVIDAVNLLAGNLAMDVGVVLNQTPDRPTPGFRFLVEAIDTPGDLCDPPIDTDADAQHLPDTHVNCRPGAAPRFRVRFTNPETPNHVRPNPSDPRGGYNMRLDLIGDGTYVVDQIPVYILAENVVADPPVQRYPESASYEQTLSSVACTGNDAPLWSALNWSASMPSGTALRWEGCTADSEQALARCTPKLLAEARTGAACTVSADCPGGSCAEDKLCRYVSGQACSRDSTCGSGGSCIANVCRWSDVPVDVRAALGPGQQGRPFARVRATLLTNEGHDAAPTVHDWRLEYTCSSQE